MGWLGKRYVVRLHGAGALKFLHDVSTVNVADLAPGTWALACFLTGKGRLVADARVLATDDGAIVDAPAEAADGLQNALVRIAPLAGVEVDEFTWNAATTDGDMAPGSWLEHDGGFIVRDGWGFVSPVLVGPRVEEAASDVADEVARIRANRPRFGVDAPADIFFNETPFVVRAVDHAKGCYPGQESVARVRNLGRTRHLLRALEVEGGRTLVAGSTVMSQVLGAVGVVRSAAPGVAIAWVGVDIGPGSPVSVDDVRAVATDAGWET